MSIADTLKEALAQEQADILWGLMETVYVSGDISA